MRVNYECECGREHQHSESLATELSGYSTDIDCGCGAKYVLNVTLLRPPGTD